MPTTLCYMPHLLTAEHWLAILSHTPGGRLVVMCLAACSHSQFFRNWSPWHQDEHGSLWFQCTMSKVLICVLKVSVSVLGYLKRWHSTTYFPQQESSKRWHHNLFLQPAYLNKSNVGLRRRRTRSAEETSELGSQVKPHYPNLSHTYKDQFDTVRKTPRQTRWWYHAGGLWAQL